MCFTLPEKMGIGGLTVSITAHMIINIKVYFFITVAGLISCYIVIIRIFVQRYAKIFNNPFFSKEFL